MPPDGNLMEEKYPHVAKKLAINFPGSPNSITLAAFSHAIGNWCSNPSISHILKYTVGFESNRKKNTQTMGKVWVPFSHVLHIWLVSQDFPRNQFLRLFPFHGFSCLFPCYIKLMRKPCIAHMMKDAIKWESNGKSIHTIGKVNVPFSQVLHIHWVL